MYNIERKNGPYKTQFITEIAKSLTLEIIQTKYIVYAFFNVGRKKTRDGKRV